MSEADCTEILEKAWLQRFPRWRSYAAAILGNREDAEEAVQEAVARTLRARPSLCTEQDAHNYVLTAVRTAALQLISRRRRSVPLGEPERAAKEGGAESPLRRVLDAEARGRSRQLQDHALAQLDALRPEQRQVIELLLLREPPMKLREVAAIQEAAISTVHSRLQAALRFLGRRLRELEEQTR
jgi:RNA polymerase sigma factor (sigma-70 family)